MVFSQINQRQCSLRNLRESKARVKHHRELVAGSMLCRVYAVSVGTDDSVLVEHGRPVLSTPVRHLRDGELWLASDIVVW